MNTYVTYNVSNGQRSLNSDNYILASPYNSFAIRIFRTSIYHNITGDYNHGSRNVIENCCPNTAGEESSHMISLNIEMKPPIWKEPIKLKNAKFNLYYIGLSNYTNKNLY